MNEIFKTLRDKFPFLSLIRKGDMEFVGIVQNQDSSVISFYDYGRIMQPSDKMRYLNEVEIFRRIIMKILVLDAHPDDEILGVGGTIKKNIDQNNEIKIAIIVIIHQSFIHKL